MPEAGRIKVFLSYAHEDEAFREQLVEYLGTLRDDGTISHWHDRLITPGSDWSREIERELEQADIVLFIVSPDFMASDYCLGVEVKQAIDLHWKHRSRIVPIIIRPTPEWTRTEFGSFQALPKDAKPVSTWAHADQALADIADGLRNVCKDIVDWENPYRRAIVGDWTETEQATLAQGRHMAFNVRVEVVGKNDRFATVAVSGSGEGEHLRAELRIDLDEPIEDKLGEYLDQIGEKMPAHGQMYREEEGRGEQKIFVGGKPYYCHWVGGKLILKAGAEGVVARYKTWRCIDVPLDGIVKSEMVMSNLTGQVMSSSSSLLIGYGEGTGEKAR